MTTFLAIVRAGSFVRAAEELGYAQSTVTLHIQELERELGTAVIDRSTRRLSLTEAGRIVEAHAGGMVRAARHLQETVAALATGEAGHVRLGAVEPAASERLGPILADFCRRRPHVRLTVEVAGAQGLSGRVWAGQLDAAVSAPPPGGLGLDFEPLFREPMGLLVPAGDRLAEAEAIDPEQLSGTTLLTTERTCAYRQVTERTLDDHGVRPAHSIEIASIRAIAHAVQAGLGMAVVPLAGVTPPPPGTVTRRLHGVDLALTIGIVTRPGSPYGAALDAMLAALRERLPDPG